MKSKDIGRPPAAATVMSIQYLRGLAALLVVFFHARNPAPWLYNPLEGIGFGRRGVDIFFVISGFIMFAAARAEPPGEFMRRRIIRVAPLYWLATLTYIAVRDLWGKADASLANVVRSLLFIPYTTRSGAAWPVLEPGWTLNYEMFFYVLFAIGLMIRWPARWTVTAIIILVTAGLVLNPTGPLLDTYTNIRLLEFVAGICLGAAYARWRFKALGWLLPAGFLAILGPDLNGGGAWLALLASAAVVAGALALERPGAPVLRPLKLLGDASYSIYLTHSMTLFYLRQHLRHMPVEGPLQFAIVLTACLGMSALVGIAVHLGIERPLLRVLTRWTRPGRPARTPIPQA